MSTSTPLPRALALALLPLAAAAAACPAPRPVPSRSPAQGGAQDAAQRPVSVVRAFEAERRRGLDGARWLAPGAVVPRAASPNEPATERPPEPHERLRELRWTLPGDGGPAGGEGGVARVELGAQGPRLRLPRLGALGAPTARGAVALLAEALLARDYEALLALLPRAEAAHWTEARLAAVWSDGRGERWDAVARALQAGVTVAASPQAPDTAVARTQRGDVAVTLIREGGRWKVADVRPHARVLGQP